MKRRKFLRQSGITAFAISATGYIHLEEGSFVGDCQTTTDILGPFYRPNAPERSNLVIDGMPGEKIMLSGRISNDDCTTALPGAKVEIWHCSADQVYDNDSEAFNYRGITYTDTAGYYQFLTQMPVPYDAGGGMYRPAHFHLMISAPGYQNLVTQLYFKGDDYLEKDPSSKSARAQKRVLEVAKKQNGIIEVGFDIVMQKELDVDRSVIDRLAGAYQDAEDDEKITHLFVHDDQLWVKNEVFGENLKYLGDNTFVMPGGEEWGRFKIKFDLFEDGMVKATSTSTSRGKTKVSTANKI